MLPSLYEIGLRYEADKSTYHLFSVLYDHWFTKLRDQPIDFLEIGIAGGASIRMWQEYFYNHNRIHAADINRTGIIFGGRVETWCVNQEDRLSLRTLPSGLDIIVDDGGHTMRQQQNCLVTLFKHLKPGGVYILEDLHTSSEFYAGQYGYTPKNNTLKFLQDLNNGVLSNDQNFFVTDTDFYGLKDQIASIEVAFVKNDSITSRIMKKS